MNTASYLLASAYSAFSPSLNTAAAVCTVNGENVACPEFLNILGPVAPIVFVVALVVTFAGMWKIFKKAGQPGWAAIIPIYNVIVMLKIIKKPIWWILLLLIPVVSTIIGIMVSYELAKAFGKGIGFTIGLVILPFIFYPILGFGESVYTLADQTPSPQPSI